MSHAINVVAALIMALVGLVMQAVGAVDAALAGLMTSAGLAPDVQVLVLVVVAIFLIIAAIRLLGGVFGVLIVILLALLLAHRLVPGMSAAQLGLPGAATHTSGHAATQ